MKHGALVTCQETTYPKAQAGKMWANYVYQAYLHLGAVCFVVKVVKVRNSYMSYNPITTTTLVWTVIRKRLTQLNYHSLATQLPLT